MKDQWFREYERLYNEREDSDVPDQPTDEELAQRASENVVERQLHRADMARDDEMS